ncbi:hypothetical protein T05_6939 [Trichinella murrelli]|uniref:Uncharacterized protein n=1 Tax=Trichinella murrelli TaxID=144512 RepID=A0A0V0UEN2_9BILA|nr:hypothetical protein T05_6939 [Trichinella murrelli]
MDNIHKIPGIVGEDIKSKCDKLTFTYKNEKHSRSLKRKNCNEYGVCGLLQICTSDLRVLYCLKIRDLLITDTGVNEKYTMKQEVKCCWA